MNPQLSHFWHGPYWPISPQPPPFPEGSPPCEKSPSVCWCVWMWKYFTTLLPLSKGSSCYVPLIIIWGAGGFPGLNHDIIVVFSDSACWRRCSLWVGGNEASLGQRLTPIPLGSAEHWWGVSLPLASLCEFNWERCFIATPFQLLQRFWGNEAAASSTVKSAGSLKWCLWWESV